MQELRSDGSGLLKCNMILEDKGAMPLKFRKKIISNLDDSHSQTSSQMWGLNKDVFSIQGLKFCLPCMVSQEATAVYPPSKWGRVGRHNKTPHTGWLCNRNSFLRRSGGWEVQHQGTGQFCSWWQLSSWLSPHMTEKEQSLPLLIKTPPLSD